MQPLFLPALPAPLRRLLSLALLLAAGLACAAAPPRWVATWGAGPSPQLATEAQRRAAHLVFGRDSLREIVHVSIGGQELRVRLSNVFGKTALDLADVHVARRDTGSAILPGTDRPLTFGGRSAIRIPEGSVVVSDPVALDLPAASDLAVTLDLGSAAEGAGIHYAALQTSYAAPGDLGSAPAFPAGAVRLSSWVFLAGVDVLAPAGAVTLVTFGDSITDGAHSTPDTNRRWPNFLAQRLLRRSGAQEVGVLDAGIGGNRVLRDAGPDRIAFGVAALARFDRDVLAQPGVRYLIVLEGINDIGHGGEPDPGTDAVSADDLIAGLSQLAARARENGIKIFGATVTPFEGARARGYFSPAKERVREALNHWIRTTDAFDGVVDFDRAVQDPAHPSRLRPEYDSGDHLHPGDAGYRAMAQAVDLALLR